MKILLLDDDGEKLRYISHYLESLGHRCIQVNHIESMKRHLCETKYDILIVDLEIPVENEEHYEGVENGFEALEYIRNTTDTLFFPKRILVLSRYLDEANMCRLNSLGVIGICYDVPRGKWREALRKELEYTALAAGRKIDADIVILTVVDNEKKQLEKVFKWLPLSVENDPLEYYFADVDTKHGQKLKLVHCHISVMGVVATSQATARVIELFEPDMVIMCGIAGGRPGKTNFGDIILAETSVNFAGGSIEETPEGAINFLPDNEVIDMIPSLVKPFRAYRNDKNLLRDIRDNSDLMDEYRNDICLHIGRIATGPAVIKSEIFAEKYIKAHNRNYIAVDMETYGMYYTAKHLGRRYLSVKSISDNADQKKNDSYQKFAALIAANLVKHFIESDYKPYK